MLYVLRTQYLFLVFVDIQPTTAITGEGIFEGFDWLASTIAQNKAKENARAIQQNATKTLTDNKTIMTGWKQALFGAQKMRDWIWGESNFSEKSEKDQSSGA